MDSLLNFAFEDDLVRVVMKDGEPWFVGRDVCHALEISNESRALAALDDDERSDGVRITDPIGRSQAVIIISEAGLFRLVFTSRKPIAEKFKRWLAHEVLPALRKTGCYELPVAERDAQAAAEFMRWQETPARDLRGAIELVKTATRLYGPHRGRLMWAQVGLPTVPDLPEPTPLQDGFACLRHLLDFDLGQGTTVCDAIELAIDGHAESEGLLKEKGIRIWEEPQGFFVANSHAQIGDIFLDTPWTAGQWRFALRSLPGGHAAGSMRFGYDVYKGTFVPERYLDGRFSQRATA